MNKLDMEKRIWSGERRGRGLVDNIIDAVKHPFRKILPYVVIGAFSFSAGNYLSHRVNPRTIKAQDTIAEREDFEDAYYNEQEGRWEIGQPYVVQYYDEATRKGVIEDDGTGNKVLVITDFDRIFGDTGRQTGHNRFNFIDKKYDLNSALGRFEFEVSIDKWFGADEVEICVGDPTMLESGTYYHAKVLANPEDVGGPRMKIVKYTPGLSFVYDMVSLKGIVEPGATHLKMCIKKENPEDYLRIFINDVDTGACFPGVEGYLAVSKYDSIWYYEGEETDGAVNRFDNIIVEYHPEGVTGGTGAGKESGELVRENLLENLLKKKGAGGGGQMNKPGPLSVGYIENVFTRADANNDLVVDISDAVRTLGYLYLGGYDLRCFDAADVNDDGKLDMSDAIFTLEALYIDPSKKFAPPNIIFRDPNGPPDENNLIMDAAMGIDTTPDGLLPCKSGWNYIPGLGLKTD